MARFSIVVAIYDTEDFVGECIESLKGQTFGDFQAVLVDDGSPDHAYDRAVASVGDDGRFTFLRQQNQGLSAARNAGVRAATGDFVLFLDSDDCYAPEALELLDFTLGRTGADVVDFSAASFYQDADARRLHREEYDGCRAITGTHSGARYLTRCVREGRYVPSACLHCIRRDMLEIPQLAFAEGLLHEDELFTPLLYAYAGLVAAIDEPLYLRRIRQDSIMTSAKGVRSVESLYRIAQTLQQWLLDQGGSYDPEFVDAFARNICVVEDAAFRYSAQADPQAMAAFIEGLGHEDRVRFDLSCRFGPLPAQSRHDDAIGSFSYRLGCALTWPVRKLRDR